jgi:RNA polymerase sigma factor (sigma-70 family)
MTLSLAPLLDHLKRLAAGQSPEADAALLERYARRRDEDAFAELLARHGPMVWRVCRRVLNDAHAAEDAFQATFLVLARRAGSIRRPEAVSGWLYGVALRVARKARSAGFRRRLHQTTADGLEPPCPAPGPAAVLTRRELLDAVDEEVRRLPEISRLPVLLCCLEGLSQEEAARRLGWTPGSVKGRLERGRARLRARLARRGLSLSAALAAAEASRTAAAAAPLAGAFVSAALAAGRGAAGFSPEVMALARAGAGVVGMKFKVLVLAAAESTQGFRHARGCLIGAHGAVDSGSLGCSGGTQYVAAVSRVLRGRPWRLVGRRAEFPHVPDFRSRTQGRASCTLSFRNRFGVTKHLSFRNRFGVRPMRLRTWPRTSRPCARPSATASA